MAEQAWTEEIDIGQGKIGFWSFIDFAGGQESPWLDMGSPCIAEITISALRSQTFVGGAVQLLVEQPGGSTSAVPMCTRTGSADDSWILNDGGNSILRPGGTGNDPRLVPLPTGRVKVRSQAALTQGSAAFFNLAVKAI